MLTLELLRGDSYADERVYEAVMLRAWTIAEVAPPLAGGHCVRFARIMCAMRTDRAHRADIAGGGPALFRLVRFWSRRWAADAARDGTGDAAHVGHVLVLEAIDAASARGSAAIGDVAVELGLDRSNASRLLAEAVSAGFVTKTVSPDDARRTELGATSDGRMLLAAARAWQEEVFAQLVAGWRAEDAHRFASYLKRLALQPLKPFDPGDRT